MSIAFEAEKKRKALTYTGAIIGAILLIVILYKWPLPETPKPVAEEIITIDLGNDMEGWGEEQPLKKGDMNSQAQPQEVPQPQKSSQNNDQADDASTDEKDKEAAPVIKPVVATPKAPINKEASQPVTNPKPVVQAPVPVQKPRTPSQLYKGPGNGNGNGANEDKGYGQGNNPNGTGDRGSPNGTPNGTGNRPVVQPNIVKYYSFSDDLPKATIFAIIKVGPGGNGGSFVAFGKKSTSTERAYITAINNHLRGVEFDKFYEGKSVTVTFNFIVN